MRIAVTGGSGFIGSHLTKALKENGYDVTVIDIIEPKEKNIPFNNTNILDINQLSKDFYDKDYVYHLAAAPINKCFTEEYIKVNFNGTINVLEAARKNDVKRVIFSSSVWVYSGVKNKFVDENMEINLSEIKHPLAATKIASEMCCKLYNMLYGIEFTILRYDVTYGPRSSTTIPLFINKAFNGEEIIIFGDGKQFRNFVYVDDIICGNIATLKKQARNKIFNLSGIEPISIKNVVNIIEKKFNNSVNVVYKKKRKEDFKGKVMSNKKASMELGWRPKISINEGIDKYISWYKNETR